MMETKTKIPVLKELTFSGRLGAPSIKHGLLISAQVSHSLMVVRLSHAPGVEPVCLRFSPSLSLSPESPKKISMKTHN